ncbi:MAG: translation initiation factor IF-2 [Candidatus Aenigmatarchaeota archaeon]|nr:MAG: translation initiation factor IF-2 [Candidatus Aenigmarchaeota archaeon]
MGRIRQPIISVLGHVDHGKTTLLDRIRESAVASKDAGGITQYIGASEVPVDVIKEICGKLAEGKRIEIPGLLLIDTPGHEAFSTLRKRGGSIADLAVLVIDIRDGFKPQTDESLMFLKEFKTPFVVAATKIDTITGWRKHDGWCFLDSYREQSSDVKRELDGAIYQLMGELSERGFSSDRFDRVQDFTKNVAIVPVSGITGEGLPDLLMMLVGLSQKFLADRIEVKEERGFGNVLEVKEVKGLGTTIDVILYDGVMRKNDYLVIGGEKPLVTQIRALLKPRELGEIRVEKSFVRVDEVCAAAGLKVAAPNLENVIPGSPFRSVRSRGEAEVAAKEMEEEVESVEIESEGEGVILKADTLGSLEALIRMIKDRNVPIRKAKIGDVTRRDVMEIKSISDPMKRAILAFNVNVSDEAKEISEGVKIFQSPVIYRLIEEFEEWQEKAEEERRKDELSKVTRPGKIRFLPGYVFRQRKPAIIGCEIEAGVTRPGYNLVKDGKIIGKIEQIQKEGTNIHLAEKGDRVAISIDGPTVGRQIEEGDILYNAISKKDLKKLRELEKYLTPSERELLDEIEELVYG